MSSRDIQNTAESAIGTDVEIIDVAPNVTFRCYLVDRPGYAPGFKAAETGMDVSIRLPHPLRRVWPVFKDFNSWMSRFGYAWDGVPADNEDKFVYLGNKGATDTHQYGAGGARTKYVVRKVIEGHLIYFDSLLLPMPNKKGVWSGHNVVALREANGSTDISFFMEHTWYSDSMTQDELRAEARGITFEAGVKFWRDYFVADLIALVETGKVQVGVAP